MLAHSLGHCLKLDGIDDVIAVRVEAVDHPFHAVGQFVASDAPVPVVCRNSVEDNPHAESELQPMLASVWGRRGPNFCTLRGGEPTLDAQGAVLRAIEAPHRRGMASVTLALEGCWRQRY